MDAVKKITILLISTGILVALINVVTILPHFIISKQLVAQAKPFSFNSPTTTQRILIIGDSTAYGVGAANPNQTTAGYFHQKYPNAEIVNISKSGAKLDDIYELFIAHDHSPYNLIVLHGGANDILYFTPLNQAIYNLEKLLVRLNDHGDHVMLITSGNLGSAPMFPAPTSWLYSYRSKLYLENFKKVAERNNVTMIDVYSSRQDDPFLNDINKYYAADRLHLSGDGYQIWFDAIVKSLKTN